MKRRVQLAVLVTAMVVFGLTVPGSSAPGDPVLRFSAAGDFSASSQAQAVFGAIGALDNDLHLALGDLSYGVTGQEQAWCDLVTAGVGAGYPFELLAGNHESNGVNGHINDFSACLPNQLPGVVGTYGRQYYVDVPKEAPLARFVMISPGIPFPDSTWSYNVGTPRYNWTAAAIDGARAANIPWVVVGMHKPCISVGQYTCDPGADIQNLLVSKRVDLVLTGHEHLYQRSKQLAHGPGCAALTPGTYNAACVEDADSNLVKDAGTVMATIGTGGVALRDVFPTDSEMPYFAATSGLNQNPTFGVLDFELTPDVLTASFERAAGGTFGDSFTITRGATPPNTPPTAAFGHSCTNLSCTFDAGGSIDTDGNIVSYDWTFGDGTTGTGVNPTHPYASPNTYTVGLTVTDDDGATGFTSSPVTVTAPPGGTTYASDDFQRTVANGLGTAPTGGAWTLGGTSSNFSVSGGSGRVVVPTAGSGRYAFLNGASSNAMDIRTVLSTDKASTGGGFHLSMIGRRVTGGGDYRAKVKLVSTGAVSLSLWRVSTSNVETAISSSLTIPGLTYAVGDRLNLRMEVSGTSPTLIRAKVWKVGTAEPGAWQLSTTDSTAAMQASGSIGFFFYLSSSVTNAPVTVLLDDLLAAAP
jgi:hypothetical protein